MPEPPITIPPRRRPPATFQPRFALSLIYLFAFFFLYCLFLIAPALYEVYQSMPPGPEQEEAAKQVAQRTVQPRLLIAVLASAFTVGLGGHFKLLPGLHA